MASYPAIPAIAPAKTLTGLRWLMVTATVVPIVMFLALAWYGYVRSSNQAHQALVQTTRIVHEHAAKVFQTNEMLLERAADLVTQAGLKAVRSREKDFYERLSELTAGITQVRALTVLDVDGVTLASTLQFPVSRRISAADRTYFINHKLHGVKLSINETFDGRFEKSPPRVFSVSRRLDDANGQFMGVIVLALSPDYFAQFYGDVSDAGMSISIFRSDGEVIARYPAPQNAWRSYDRTGSLMKVISDGATEGVVDGLLTPGETYRLAAFRQVAPYPLYVAVSRTSDSVLAEARHDIAILAGFVVPGWLALMLAVWIAFKRARSEHDAIVHWHDETTRRGRAEDQLRQMQKYQALGELTGGLAHDFNNLLNIVSTSADVMSLLPRHADLHPHLSAIKRAVASGTALTKHLLAFARKQPLSFAQVRTVEAVPDICELARRSLPKAIELKYDVDPDVHDILADRAELELAIINLTVNARDAMPNGGCVTVRARNLSAAAEGTAELPDTARDYVAISVSDTGTGIPEAVMARIFEPFFSTKKEKGTGLGLSRVYGYVMQLGGYVTAKNGASGGAVITLYLPAVKASSEDPQKMTARVNG